MWCAVVYLLLMLGLLASAVHPTHRKTQPIGREASVLGLAAYLTHHQAEVDHQSATSQLRRDALAAAQSALDFLSPLESSCTPPSTSPTQLQDEACRDNATHSLASELQSHPCLSTEMPDTPSSCSPWTALSPLPDLATNLFETGTISLILLLRRWVAWRAALAIPSTSPRLLSSPFASPHLVRPP
ncbi:hypothetical protein ACQY0O_000395 [Thecaphora frezii]